MKPLLSLAVLALLAVPARADSTASFDVTAFAEFDVNGQPIEASYSYQVTEVTVTTDDNGIINEQGTISMSGLSFTVAGDGSWFLDGDGGQGAFALTNGSLVFGSSLRCVAIGCPIDQEMIDPSGIFEPLTASSATLTPMQSPEPASLSLIAIGLLGLASLKRKVA